MTNRIANKKLQRWFAKEQEAQFDNKISLSDGEDISVPTTEFNLVYQLLHIYRHLFGEGIGLRQLMDYYMVLRTVENGKEGSERYREVKNVVFMLGLRAVRFCFDVGTRICIWFA